VSFVESSISWQWGHSGPTSRPEGAIVWTPSDIELSRDVSFVKSIDELLAVKGAGSFVEAAFQKKCTRSQSWDVDLLSSSEKTAAIAAARVYKRGVPVKGQSHQSRSGASKIIFAKSAHDTLSKIHKRDFVLIDQQVFNHWKGILPSAAAVMSFSEANKNPQSALEVLRLIPDDCARVVIIGGGVLGDIAGFAAGVKSKETVYIPTTLLSMVDSSVGGKTGVNVPPWGKNQIGLFWVPTEVMVSTEWLETLPERETRSGLVECLKHALLSADLDLWQRMILLAKNKEWSKLNRDLARIVQFKVDVVARDPMEEGERVVLNFGHTLGHALETVSYELGGESPLTHGECVAVGMCYALGLSRDHCKFADAGRYIKDLRDAGLVPKLSQGVLAQMSKWEALLLKDKKNTSDATVQWVLLHGPGQVCRRQENGSGELWTVPMKAGLNRDLLCEVLGL